MIQVLINRMLITNSIVEIHPGLDPTGRDTPFKAPHRAIFSDCYDDDDDLIMARSPGGRLPVNVIELDIKPQRPLLED